MRSPLFQILPRIRQPNLVARFAPASFLPCGLCLYTTTASAAACECDHEITTDQLTISGEELGVSPGDVVCILGGEREFLRISAMVGTEEAPIVIQNCEGQVDIDNSERGYGLTLDASRYVHLTGSGDDTVTYGFKVRATRTGPDYSASCVLAGDRSSDYEIDHIEALDCGFAGVVSKTDPTCETQDMSGFVQRNTRLHHLYLHDTGGEGIYFGNTGYPSRAGTCDGEEVDLIPHTHEGVWIHDNIIEDTGWDGAQIGVSPKDCYFYRNRIARVGLLSEEYQMQGLQIGGGSQCEITDNFLSTGNAIGIIVLDASDTLIANNVIEGFETGIYFNDRASPVTEGAQYRALHNTLVDMIDQGIAAYGQLSVGNIVSNNFLVNAGETPLALSSEVDMTSEGNVTLDSVSDAGFASVQEENYQLDEGSPAVDSGVDLSAEGITLDQRGAPRDSSPDAGAYEYGATAPDEPLSPPGPGENPSSPASGETDSKGGCSIVATPARPGQYWFVWAATLLGILGFRRSHKVPLLRAAISKDTHHRSA